MADDPHHRAAAEAAQDSALLASRRCGRVSICATLLALVTLMPWGRAQQTSPHIGYVYPAGGRQGAVFQVAVGGQFLNNATNAFVSGPGVQSVVIDYSRPLTQKEFNDLRDKLKELQDLFWIEAENYQVLPLDASGLERLISPKPSIVAGRDEFTYTRPIAGIPQGTAPSILNRTFTITANMKARPIWSCATFPVEH